MPQCAVGSFGSCSAGFRPDKNDPAAKAALENGRAPASVGVLGWISEIRQAWRTFAPPYLLHRRRVHDLKFLSWCIFSDAFQCMLIL